MQTHANSIASIGMPPEPVEFLQTRFGPVPLNSEQQISFKGGLPGFPNVELFQLNQIPGVSSELLLLQAVDEPELGFIVFSLPSTVPVIAPKDIGDVCQTLKISAGDLLLLVMVTLRTSDEGVKKFANIRAPLFVDVRRRVGAQVVLASNEYSLRLPLD